MPLGKHDARLIRDKDSSGQRASQYRVMHRPATVEASTSRCYLMRAMGPAQPQKDWTKLRLLYVLETVMIGYLHIILQPKFHPYSHSGY